VFEASVAEFGKYIHRDDVREFVIHANDRYLYWDQVIYRPKPEDISYELLWGLIKTFRDYDKIIIREIEDFTFHYSRTDYILQKLHEFDMNMGGQISGSIIPEDDKEKYLISSLMEEAIASSQLEGAATTREVAKEMLRKGLKPKDHSQKMIVNNYRTIKRIVELKDEPLSVDMILDIHASMTKDTLEDSDDEGRFRKSNDIIVIDESSGKTLHTPPDYNLIPKLIDNLCDFANSNSKARFMHPIIKASFLHFLIGYIHPFIDGNGRTARAIFYWYLVHHNYWLIEFMTISRVIKKVPSQYKRAYLYTEMDDNDVTYFLYYQIKMMEQSLKDLRKYINRQIKKQRTGIFDKLLRMSEINLRQAHLLMKFIEKPYYKMTIHEVENRFNVVYQTARTDLIGLVEKGFLVSSTGPHKKLTYTRSEGFNDVLDQRTN